MGSQHLKLDLAVPSPDEYMRRNDSSIGDLELPSVIEQFLAHVPSSTKNRQARGSSTSYNIKQLLERPLVHQARILERQDAISEIYDSPDLASRVTTLFHAAESLSEDGEIRTYDLYKRDVQIFERAHKLIDFVEAACALPDNNSTALTQIKAFGEQITSQQCYQKMKRFTHEIYERFDLSSAFLTLYEAMADTKNGLDSVDKKRKLYTSLVSLTSSLKQILDDDFYRSFFPHDELERIRVLATLSDTVNTFTTRQSDSSAKPKQAGLKSFLGSIADSWNYHLMRGPYKKTLPSCDSRDVISHADKPVTLPSIEQELSDAFFDSKFLDVWRLNRGKLAEISTYLLKVMHEAVSANLPPIAEEDIKTIAVNTGFYLGAANLQHTWNGYGAQVSRPTLLAKEDRCANVLGAYPLHLLREDKPLPKPDNISTSPQAHFFVITGPNDGGKSTHARLPGQIQWLAQLGMYIPASEGAKLSIRDAIYTCFNEDDNPSAGRGTYHAQLYKVAKFLLPQDSTRLTTPYTLMLINEFASGTAYDDGPYRNQVLLEHISEKGFAAYLTTHFHDIADWVDSGGKVSYVLVPGDNGHSHLPGGMCLGMKDYQAVPHFNAPSEGNVVAEKVGITPSRLHAQLIKEVMEGLYPVEHTRLDPTAALFTPK